jgi:hypothetical protein
MHTAAPLSTSLTSQHNLRYPTASQRSVHADLSVNFSDVLTLLHEDTFYLLVLYMEFESSLVWGEALDRGRRSG